MAKIYEEVVVIKLSKLVKDDEANSIIAGTEVMLAMEEVAQELVGASVIVEVARA